MLSFILADGFSTKHSQNNPLIYFCFSATAVASSSSFLGKKRYFKALNRDCVGDLKYDTTSVSRLGDLLNFRQLVKAIGSN